MNGGPSPRTDAARPVPLTGAVEALAAAFGADVAAVPTAAHSDERGRLLEITADGLPFAVARVFTVADVPAGTTRGGHRHRTETQALFCTTGRVDVTLRRGESAARVTLSPGGPGLLIGAGVWAEQHYVEAGSTLLVMASHPYDPDDYESDG